jgi:periplasmic protein TonB
MVKRTRRRVITRLGGGLAACLLIAGFVWFVRAMMAGQVGKPQRQIQVVQIIRPPPPPPPDQPPPPPPEKTPQPLPKDQPDPVPDNQPAPADQPLGLDADGGADGDAFGLAARRGGSDLVGGSGSAPFAWYTSRITDAIRERLSGLACTHGSKGSLSFHIRIDAQGRFTQAELASTTGNSKVDQCIEAAVASTPPISDPPPPGMTEQLTVKVVSRI